MRLAPLFLCLLLAACGRPLDTAEMSFANNLLGPGLDPAPIRIKPSRLIGNNPVTIPTRPQTTCRERIFPAPTTPTVEARTAGIVVFSQLFTNPDWYLDSYTAQFPDRVSLVSAMYLAHELTHIWQWQQREKTGYSPLKAAGEHLASADPYLFDPSENPDFLDFGYEQQASLVEEFVCCHTIDPAGARTARLAQLLQGATGTAPLASLPIQTAILPWDGADLRGICS